MATQRQCKRALERFEQELTSLKNVVGLGIVPAEESEETRGRRECAVAVYVVKKLPIAQLAAADVVPETLSMPGRGGAKVAVPTRVIEQGEVRLESQSESL